MIVFELWGGDLEACINFRYVTGMKNYFWILRAEMSCMKISPSNYYTLDPSGLEVMLVA